MSKSLALFIVVVLGLLSFTLYAAFDEVDPDPPCIDISLEGNTLDQLANSYEAILAGEAAPVAPIVISHLNDPCQEDEILAYTTGSHPYRVCVSEEGR